MVRVYFAPTAKRSYIVYMQRAHVASDYFSLSPTGRSNSDITYQQLKSPERSENNNHHPDPEVLPLRETSIPTISP